MLNSSLNKQFPGSFTPVSTESVLILCEKQLRAIEKKEQEEIESLILKYMKPKQFLSWKKEVSREDAIKAINKCETIGIISDIALSSPKEEVEDKWYEQKQMVLNILELALFAEKNNEEKIYLITKDCKILNQTYD